MNDSARPLGDLLQVRRILGPLGVSIEYRTRAATITLQPLTKNAVKVSLRFGSPKRQISSTPRPLALLPRPWSGAPLEIEEQDDAVLVRAGELLIRAERSPLRFSYARGDEPAFLSEIAGGGMLRDYWDIGLVFDLPADEAFYGLGETGQRGLPAPAATPEQPAQSTVPLNHRGRQLPIWHWHQPPSRLVQPVLLSSRRYGLLIDNPLKARWDLGASNPDCFSYETDGGLLDMILFAGESLVDLLDTYTDLTGRYPLPPIWSLGYLQSRHGYRDHRELSRVAKTLREHDIPCDGLVLDVHWFDQMGDLHFAPSRWPDPANLIAQLKEQGFHLILNEEPYLTQHSRLFPEAFQRGFLASRPDGQPYLLEGWPGRTGLLDFTSSKVRRWWGVEHRPLIHLGVDGFRLDLNEPTDHPIDMQHVEGPAAMVHNRFANDMVESVVDAWQENAPNRRPFIMTRAGFAGLQRTGAALCSGGVDISWEALATQVALGQNVGMAGFAGWNSDIGGFSRKVLSPQDLTYSEEYAADLDRAEDPELYLRWLQFGVFSPICRVHCDQYRRREPWAFGPAVEEIARQYIRLRYRLLPYLYSAYYAAYTRGLPIMRPLVLHYEDDPVAPKLTDQYLFGRDLLIAPVLAPGARSRRVYLPAGGWYDSWNERYYQGPGWIETDAPLDRIPMFVRAGALVPFGPHQAWIGQRPLDPLTLHYYAGLEPSHFDLYEDDGRSLGYRRGESCITPIRAERIDDNWHLYVDSCRGFRSEASHPRTILFWLHGMGPMGGIQRDERPLPPLASREAWRKVKAGWWHNAEKNMIGVKVQPSDGPIVLHAIPRPPEYDDD